MRTCALCGHELPDAADPIEAKVAELFAQCDRLRIAVTEDGMVAERDAAELLGRSAGGLRNLRIYDDPPPLAWVVRDSRIYYRLAELGRFIIERTTAGDCPA